MYTYVGTYVCIYVCIRIYVGNKDLTLALVHD